MYRSLFRPVLALSFIIVGVLHFINPEPFITIMPSILPWPLELVYLSGLCEFLGGVGLLIPTTRHLAAWGLIALLIAVYPANINMLINDIYIGDMPRERWLLWLRMPLQFLIGLGVLWGGEIGPFKMMTSTSSATKSDESS